MKRLARDLKKRRAELGLLQREMAYIIGINPSTYGKYERGRALTETATSRKIRNSVIWEKRAERLDIHTLADIDAKRSSKYRIPNICGFMEKLNSVSDENGAILVDANHPVLQDLRESLGLYRIRK